MLVLQELLMALPLLKTTGAIFSQQIATGPVPPPLVLMWASTQAHRVLVPMRWITVAIFLVAVARFKTGEHLAVRWLQLQQAGMLVWKVMADSSSAINRGVQGIGQSGLSGSVNQGVFGAASGPNDINSENIGVFGVADMSAGFNVGVFALSDTDLGTAASPNSSNIALYASATCATCDKAETQLKPEQV